MDMLYVSPVRPYYFTGYPPSRFPPSITHSLRCASRSEVLLFHYVFFSLLVLFTLIHPPVLHRVFLCVVICRIIFDVFLCIVICRIIFGLLKLRLALFSILLEKMTRMQPFPPTITLETEVDITTSKTLEVYAPNSLS
jgi:hypothetical protein